MNLVADAVFPTTNKLTILCIAAPQIVVGRLAMSREAKDVKEP
jgi:hypothetical protein